MAKGHVLGHPRDVVLRKNFQLSTSFHIISLTTCAECSNPGTEPDMGYAK
jgi:hypothetical protein